MKSVINAKLILLTAINLFVVSGNAGIGFGPGAVDYYLSCNAKTQETQNPSLVDFIEAGGTWTGIGDDSHMLQFHVTKYSDSVLGNVFINVPIYDEAATLQFHSHFSGMDEALAEAQRFSIYKKYQLLGRVKVASSSPEALENLQESDVLTEEKSPVEVNHLRLNGDSLDIRVKVGGESFAVSAKCKITQ